MLTEVSYTQVSTLVVAPARVVLKYVSLSHTELKGKLTMPPQSWELGSRFHWWSYM